MIYEPDILMISHSPYNPTPMTSHFWAHIPMIWHFDTVPKKSRLPCDQANHCQKLEPAEHGIWAGLTELGTHQKKSRQNMRKPIKKHHVLKQQLWTFQVCLCMATVKILSRCCDWFVLKHATLVERWNDIPKHQAVMNDVPMWCGMMPYYCYSYSHRFSVPRNWRFWWLNSKSIAWRLNSK